uniref:Minor capsid protein P8 central region domain-containing protein n=1 Tax=viral metagenome TaxID=1070528 RepID=A0A6C0H5M6_9ZZZZ
MTIIQNAIRANVYHRSNKQYIVAPFDCDALKIIMRAIFLQHSDNNFNNIKQQISNLNQMVIDFCVPKVFSEAQSYLRYLYDVDNLVQPIPRPVLSSQSDKFDLKLPNWF